MITKMISLSLFTMVALAIFPGASAPTSVTSSQDKQVEQCAQQNAGLYHYSRSVPNADCGTTDNLIIFLENDTVELAPGVPVWVIGPGGYQPLAWALVFSNWGNNSGTAYFILNGYVHSSFIPC